MIASNPLSILCPNLVLWCIIMHSSSKYDSVYCIFCTADPFATKLGLIVHYHKPECFMEKLDCCVQGQGHSRISNYQWMFVQMLSSETLNLLLLNLVWWCNIMSQIVFEKDWFAVFKIMVIVMDNVIKIWQFLLHLLNCWSFCFQICFDNTLS